MKDIKSLCDQVQQIAYGLLINFGSYKFEIRKFAWSEQLQRQAARGVFSLVTALFAFFAVK